MGQGTTGNGAEMSRTANDHETGFEVDAEVKAVLLKAIAECDRGEKIGADELLRGLLQPAVLSQQLS
ncbi:MAG TPA: hypothetical protein VFO89_16640 [Thermoanaerobaculia bacterium]|nr:hypothetical protein [Thermoanaerobaculia bacterium]